MKFCRSSRKFRSMRLEAATSIGKYEGEIEFRGSELCIRRQRRFCTILTLRIPAGSSLAIVGPTGSGKTHAGQSDSAHLRCGAGNGSDRWPADPRIFSGIFAEEYWLCAAGNISVQRPHPGKHCAGREGPRRIRRFATRPMPPTLPPISKASPSAIRPWLASAASRFPAGRSSAPRLPAH